MTPLTIPAIGPHGLHHPMLPGERLLMINPVSGLLDEADGWSVEVENVAIYGCDMPEQVIALNLVTMLARDLTGDFRDAVDEASEPDTHEADETAMLHASHRAA